jgi:hypothetical protein
MPLPISRSAVERLGKRLVTQLWPAPEDVEMLQRVLLDYGQALEEAVGLIAAEFESTSRLKTTGSTIAKLHRLGGSMLKSIVDLAGMRIVRDMNRSEQDDLVRKVSALLGRERSPQIIDRRLDPRFGYRAVHIVARVRGLPVEVQVRTARQHQWAEVFEKLADKVGHGIKYGELPKTWHHKAIFDFSRLVDGSATEEDDPALGLYSLSYVHRVAMVRSARALADLIAIVEQYDSSELERPEAFNHEEEDWEAVIAHSLADLREAINEFADPSPDVLDGRPAEPLLDHQDRWVRRKLIEALELALGPSEEWANLMNTRLGGDDR